MLYKYKHIPEIYYMKHIHDNNNNYVEYHNTILKKTLSPHIFKNKRMEIFLEHLQLLLSIFFDKFNIIKNFKNYMVDKYYYKHVK